MPQAYIQSIDEKQTSVGTMYDFRMSDGNKVGAGKFPPKGFSAGDYVNYDFTMKGQYMNLKAGSMSKATPPAGVPAPDTRTSAATSGYGAKMNTSGFDERQEIISKQAALNSAMTFTNLLVAADALPMAKNTKQDIKADIIEEVVMRYTARFYNLATGKDYPMPEASADNGTDLGAAEAADGTWEE